MTLIEIMMVLSVVAAMFGLTIQMYKQCTTHGRLLKSQQNTVTFVTMSNDQSSLLKETKFDGVRQALDLCFGDDEYKVSRQEMSLSKARKEKELLPSGYFAVISDQNGQIILDGNTINEKVYLWIGSADYII